MKLTVIRICNLDIDRNFRGVCEYIDLTVKNLSLSQLRWQLPHQREPWALPRQLNKLEFDEGGLDTIETIILCSILAVIVFGIQFVLCNKANNKSVKRIPMYIILALYAIALILCLVDWLDGSGGVAIWVIFAFIISIANTVALVADIIAWVVYNQIQKK